MPHSLTNNLLAAAGVRLVASQKALQARKRDKRLQAKAHKSRAVFLVTLAWSYIDGYRTPRPGGYLREDHPDGPRKSWWGRLKQKKRLGAMVRFLGVPTMIFNRIVSAAKPLDERGNRGGSGRPRWLDLEDLVALGLRRTQVFGKQECFEPEFGLTRTCVSRYLEYAEYLIHDAMLTIPEARFGFPDPVLSKAAWKAAQMKFGKFPEGTIPKGEVIDYLLDGTRTRGRSCSNWERQQLFLGKNKVISYNHIIAFSYTGVIIDMSVAHPGSVHDAKAARHMFKRLQDPDFNPGRVSALVDVGLRGFCNSNFLPGRVNVYRPQMKESYGDVDPDLADRFSARATVLRQPDEMGNGQFKRSFALLEKIIGIDVDSQRQLARDFLTCGRIFNMRTRLVGMNQVKTMFMPLIDANFEEQLNTARNFEDYCQMVQDWPHLDAILV